MLIRAVTGCRDACGVRIAAQSDSFSPCGFARIRSRCSCSNASREASAVGPWVQALELARNAMGRGVEPSGASFGGTHASIGAPQP